MKRPERKMSEREYVEAIQALRDRAAEAAAHGDTVNEAAVSEQEHELTVKYALEPGLDERTRDALRQIFRGFSLRRDQLIREYAQGRLAPTRYAQCLNTLTRDAVENYRRLLSPSQLKAFLGVVSPDEANLPLDMQQISQSRADS